MDFNSRAIAVFKIAYTIKWMAYEPHNVNVYIGGPCYALDVGRGNFIPGREVYYQICLCVPIMWRDDDRSTLIDEPLSYKVVKFMKIRKYSTAYIDQSS